MGQAFVNMGTPMNHAEEQGLLGSKYVANLPSTSYWCGGSVMFIDAAVSMGKPEDGQGFYWPGMRQEQFYIRVDAADTAAQLAAKVRAEVNAIASSIGITVPANQVLISTYSRV